MLLHRARDIHKCLKNIGSFTDDQAQVVNWDSDTLEWINIQILPKDGPYAGGKYNFMIKFDKQYPKQPPQVDCVTPIYHPNIDMTGEDYNVCLSLFDEWLPSYGLEDVIQGLLFLLYYPNLEDPLSPWFDPSMDTNEFAENLKKTLRGEVIEDAVTFVFPKMIEAETEHNLENMECAETTKANASDSEDVCDSPTGVNSRGRDTEADSLTVPSMNRFSSGEENHTSSDKISHKETDITIDGTVDKDDNKKLGSGLTDINRNESDTPVPGESTCTGCSDLVTYIEDNFLTGFSELMAIDLFSDDDDDDELELESESEEDYEELYGEDSDVNDEDTSSSESDEMLGVLWKDKMFSLFHSVIGRYLVTAAPPEQSGTRLLDTLNMILKGSCIQTCVDTGYTFCEDDLDAEELYRLLLSGSQCKDICIDLSDKESWSVETYDTDSTVFSDSLYDASYSDCNRTTGCNVLKDTAFLAGCFIMSKMLASYKLFHVVAISVYTILAWKYMEYPR